MRFLIDAQLPRRLAQELNARGHDAIHTLELPDGNATTDDEIGRLADRERRIVVSKDSDFRDGHLVRGVPRQLLVVRTGNIGNPALLAIMERHLTAIEAAFAEADLVELSAAELVVHVRP